MTALRTPITTSAGLPGSAALDTDTVSADEVSLRAHWRHQATVVTISGDIDALTGGRVQGFATRFVLAGNAVVLDFSGVDFFAARGISVLIGIDEACRAAAVPWALIPSTMVSRVLRLTGYDTTVPTAHSVAEAMRQVTALTQTRRRFALLTATDTLHAT